MAVTGQHGMDIGAAATRQICARRRWNATGIELVAGHDYELTATGTWRDWYIRCCPDGYASRHSWIRSTERWRRVPATDWFTLIGSVGRHTDNYFVIGAGRRYRPDRAGELLCFANDIPIMYFNNRGAVTLTITRLT